MNEPLCARLTARPTAVADIPFVLAAESHPDNAPYVTQCSQSWHEGAIASKDCAHFIFEAPQATPSKASNEGIKRNPMGYSVLAGIESPHRSLEIRRIVVVEKGQGYGREILQWVKAFAFEKLGHHRLWLDVLESNHRAKALYESEEFVAEGIIREGAKTATGYESMILMSMLESEYLR